MLKVRLIRFENVVLMKVLEQTDIERGCGDVFEYEDMEIYSAAVPQLTGNAIYIRGREDSYDGSLASKDCGTVAEATEYFAKVKRIIEAYNASCTGEKEHKQKFKEHIQKFDEDIIIGG